MLFSQQQLVILDQMQICLPQFFVDLPIQFKKKKDHTDHTVSAYANIPLKGSKTDLEKRKPLFYSIVHY